LIIFSREGEKKVGKAPQSAQSAQRKYKCLKCTKLPRMPKVGTSTRTRRKNRGQGFEDSRVQVERKESGGRSFTIRIPQSKIRNTELLTPVV
jgi:hypothetical protein